jgi:hypothetical protein
MLEKHNHIVQTRVRSLVIASEVKRCVTPQNFTSAIHNRAAWMFSGLRRGARNDRLGVAQLRGVSK